MKKILLISALVVLTLFLVACARQGDESAFVGNAKATGIGREDAKKLIEKSTETNKIVQGGVVKLTRIVSCPTGINIETPYFVTYNSDNIKITYGIPDDQKGKEFAWKIAVPKTSKDENGDTWMSKSDDRLLQKKKCNYEGAIYCYYGKNPTDNLFEIRTLCPNAKDYNENSCECS